MRKKSVLVRDKTDNGEEGEQFLVGVDVFLIGHDLDRLKELSEEVAQELQGEVIRPGLASRAATTSPEACGFALVPAMLNCLSLCHR